MAKAKPHDGGPAFPAVQSTDEYGPVRSPGMSVRCWLAGQALQGLLANGQSTSIVEHSVMYADRMMVRLGLAPEVAGD